MPAALVQLIRRAIAREEQVRDLQPPGVRERAEHGRRPHHVEPRSNEAYRRLTPAPASNPYGSGGGMLSR